MPSSAPLSRYTLIAFVVVVVLMAFAAANRSLLFRLMDPAGTGERAREQELRALGSSDTALSLEQANELFERYIQGERAAGLALVHQGQKNGLPHNFIDHLEAILPGRSENALKASQLIEQMALHRAFDAEIEQILLGNARPAKGGTYTQPIITLGNIGSHRPLAEPTLTLLLEVALARSPADRVALAALEKTAKANGLPEWVLDRLEEIAETRPGTVRSDAIKVIAASGASERAMALANAVGSSPVNREAVALTLKAKNLTQLDQILRDSSLAPEIRSGALTQIVRRRDQSEFVGRALSYAFASNDMALRLAAFSTYSEWGRHHSSYIHVDWRDVCTRAFADDNEAIRVHAASSFRFIPFADLTARDLFLLEMLRGTETQKQTALRAISGTRMISDAVKSAVVELAGSRNPDVAGLAGVLKEQYRPKGRFEGLGSWLAGAVFWFLLTLPAFTAIGFETYFVARLLQSIAEGHKRAAPLLASIAWFALSVGLGLLLSLGVLAIGHGDGSNFEIYLVLLVINAVFAGVAMLFRELVRKGSAAD